MINCSDQILQSSHTAKFIIRSSFYYFGLRLMQFYYRRPSEIPHTSKSMLIFAVRIDLYIQLSVRTAAGPAIPYDSAGTSCLRVH